MLQKQKIFRVPLKCYFQGAGYFVEKKKKPSGSLNRTDFKLRGLQNTSLVFLSEWTRILERVSSLERHADKHFDWRVS